MPFALKEIVVWQKTMETLYVFLQSVYAFTLESLTHFQVPLALVQNRTRTTLPCSGQTSSFPSAVCGVTFVSQSGGLGVFVGKLSIAREWARLWINVLPPVCTSTRVRPAGRSGRQVV